MHPALSKHGQEVAAAALAAPRHEIVRGRDWIASVPFLGGVYVIWRRVEGGFIPVYVGESSNLRDRLDEMTRLGRHNALFKLTDKPGVRIRNASILDAPEIVGLLVSFVVIPVGRKEAEDYLISLWRSHLKNKHDQRFKRRSDWESFLALEARCRNPPPF
jgi:hypothetical protein